MSCNIQLIRNTTIFVLCLQTIDIPTDLGFFQTTTPPPASPYGSLESSAFLTADSIAAELSMISGDHSPVHESMINIANGLEMPVMPIPSASPEADVLFFQISESDTPKPAVVKTEAASSKKARTRRPVSTTRKPPNRTQVMCPHCSYTSKAHNVQRHVKCKWKHQDMKDFMPLSISDFQ